MATQAARDRLILTLASQQRKRKETSLWLDAWRRLFRNKAAMVSLVFILALFIVALLAPWLTPYRYYQTDLAHVTESSSAVHPFGTDRLGRDVLCRLMYGARISLSVGVVSMILMVSIGVPMGAIAGYFGGYVDTLIMRIVDILYAFPSLLFVIIIMSYLKGVFSQPASGWLGVVARLYDATGGLIAIFLALGLTGWLTVARLVRGQILAIKEKEFAEAARCIGATDWHIITKHLIPNSLAPVIVAVALRVPGAVFTEAGLSFIGLGVDPPTPSWGIMISEGQSMMRSYPHLMVIPGLALSITVICFNLLGDGLRDALDPLMK